MPATTFQDLPLADRARAWDADKAEQGVRRWASSDGSGDKETMDWPKYRKAFMWYDDSDEENFGAYKLIFAEVIDGKLYAVPRGIFAVAAVLRGSRGGVDIPEADQADVKRHVARYYQKLDMTPPWEEEAASSASIEYKSFKGSVIEDADAGIVTAVFSTFGVVDADGDIVEPGAIKPGPVRVSAYGHSSWTRLGSATPPVGRGIIYTDDAKAWAEMQFFLDTTHGRDTFNTIKGMGELQEWSYSLRNVIAEYETIDGRPIRRIKSVDVHEVSPVLLGASVGTHTMSVKAGMRFNEHIDLVLADVIELNERAQEVVALRAAKGKLISEVSRDKLDMLAAQLKALQELLSVQDPEAEAEKLVEDMERECLRFISLSMQ